MSNYDESPMEQNLRAMQRGLEAEIPASEKSVVWGGKLMSAAEVHARLRHAIALMAAARQAYLAYRAAVARRRASAAEVRRFYEDGVLFVRSHYGRDGIKLTSFGLARQKPRRRLTPEQQLIAIAKRAATRALRKRIG